MTTLVNNVTFSIETGYVIFPQPVSLCWLLNNGYLLSDEQYITIPIMVNPLTNKAELRSYKISSLGDLAFRAMIVEIGGFLNVTGNEIYAVSGTRPTGERTTREGTWYTSMTFTLDQLIITNSDVYKQHFQEDP